MVTATEEGIFTGTTVDFFRPPPDNEEGGNGTSPNVNAGSGSSFNEIMLTEDDDETIATGGADSILGLAGRDSIEGRGGGDRIFGKGGGEVTLGQMPEIL